MDPVEDLTAEVDEPPDELNHASHIHHAFDKANPRMLNRRESLLTRQLHSETEHTDEEDMSRRPPRALSTQSTWSNPSVASTAELTSDDGHSVASPAISPLLPPTHVRSIIPISEKPMPLTKEPQIIGHEEKVAETAPEKSVEEGLGRKRCISFACGNKEKTAPTSQPVPSPPKEVEPQSSEPPKRKCTLKFVCPTRGGAEAKRVDKASIGPRRPVSPAPPERKSLKGDEAKAHRGSDSTVTHVSPRSVRKTPVIVTTTGTPATPNVGMSTQRKLSNDSDMSTAATRFHEFASSEDEPEEWVQESTCHRSRLTVSDTLQKENIIRKACEEVEEEVVAEEEEEDEDEDNLDDGDDDDADNDDEEDGIEAEEESDDGFHTDDEDGFAESDSEGEESDEDWWRPGALSTAATSIDHLDRLALAKKDNTAPSSSVGSASSMHSGNHFARPVPKNVHRRHHKLNVPMRTRAAPVDLPDSTDFVCGTLDEDRPLEQAYLNHLKEKEAARHKARPQDIDPSFPTSDPELDEEDDEDLIDSESEKENLIHGELEELDGDLTARRRASPRPRARSNAHRSPPPPVRHRSPAPGPLKRQSTARSPPPPVRRNTARSPPPRKLFGHSPNRARSPAPVNMMTSPPNTRRASPSTGHAFEATADILASRPQLTHTASLPRGGFMLGKMSSLRTGELVAEDVVGDNVNGDIPKRGAIDIFKGLEKKRQRRKEKLYQKACAKAAAKGEKAYKVKPGKGAERMREVGLELQRYHGKGEHILSM
ncbi:Hypothetical predicted protein [Lecanosticta acicola]|uniref:Uncharacterized protein n=1 Tax=Lecanosticta acicola TaxID=111012 RepID=A0AAI9ED43_9PEZI|nr:Hypothetical predicted protein [Lecanosticta acicola]